MWVAGVPLLGPTVYARYDMLVTAVAVAALLAGARRPRLMGGAGGSRGDAEGVAGAAADRRRAPPGVGAAAVTAGALGALFALAMPGAFAFLTFQRDRGTEIESLGALVFHVARHFGWDGQVLLNYGSVEFLGPYVGVVSTAALALSGIAFGWLLLWRLSATRFLPRTLADAAFVAVLMFTATSRVISPQYMVWLVGLAAVCLGFRRTGMRVPAALVLTASLVTTLEFPLWFSHVVAGDALGVTLLFVRNGLLVLAALAAARELWHTSVPRRPDPPGRRPAPGGDPADGETPAGEAAHGDPADGETPAEEAAHGDPADGETPAEEAAHGDPADGETPAEEAAHGDPADGETPAEEAAHGDPADGETPAEEAAGEEAADRAGGAGPRQGLRR
ncbi:hypothetical protein GCM10020295_61520 [Streptomyces cinereospinus]